MSAALRKITITLPGNLVDFADGQADALRISRSRFIAEALSQFEATDEEQRAAEGYRFFASEATEFAAATAGAVAEAWDHDS